MQPQSKGERLILDRFEGEYAVCEREDGRTVDFARVELPPEAREGDVLYAQPGGGFAIDRRETAERRAAARKLLNDLLYKHDV